MIVVDTNVVAYFLISSELSESAEAVREADPLWAAPVLWRSEMRSVLLGYLKRRQMTLLEVQQQMSDAEALLNDREYDVESGRVLELADRSGCTAYYCEFVYVAERFRLPLVTSDKELLRAFPDIAMSMEDFLTL